MRTKGPEKARSRLSKMRRPQTKSLDIQTQAPDFVRHFPHSPQTVVNADEKAPPGVWATGVNSATARLNQTPQSQQLHQLRTGNHVRARNLQGRAWLTTKQKPLGIDPSGSPK
jgi:hypothetical protein